MAVGRRRLPRTEATRRPTDSMPSRWSTARWRHRAGSQSPGSGSGRPSPGIGPGRPSPGSGTSSSSAPGRGPTRCGPAGWSSG
ncbi:hypothetical protein FM125_01735 [Micrococcus lylae]|uniref:Uncharacterized protein n=1 Tax=Micrococcus lylae TaxID=1273 RepID=A0A1R4IDR2_9MICC|nr:hypothetical protein FM125_01735 [Micrococcus lylae]